ncbi:MAG: HAMP domain-containing histidine kinase [Oscillospiraceae bacterium]|nr:HAMP domain-containing histidine kinase [Oscillospiraceae bacterium]
MDMSVDQGTARTAAELRLQLANMTMASRLLGGCAQDEKSRDYLAMLDQSICRMLRVVGRLELSARLGEEDPPRMDWGAADLARLTGELGERMAGLLASVDVTLKVNVPERLAARVDEGLVRQLIMELVSNGAKAGRHVTLTLAAQGDRAVFTVEDDGPGIAPERLKYLFSSEEEAVPNWRRGGVGVAIARRAAALHGGTLVASCAPGKGLRAVASIPLGEPGGAVLESPGLSWDRGGFDDELVALSDLLPAKAFQMEDR